MENTLFKILDKLVWVMDNLLMGMFIGLVVFGLIGYLNYFIHVG